MHGVSLCKMCALWRMCVLSGVGLCEVCALWSVVFCVFCLCKVCAMWNVCVKCVY